MKRLLTGKYLYLFLVAFCLCYWPSSLFAEEPNVQNVQRPEKTAKEQKEYWENINFEHIDQAQGLSSNSVTCILQDKKGFLWIGTEYGLNRYDGNQFKVYRKVANSPNSISGNIITAIYQDHNEILWIGTADGGLNRYNPYTDTFSIVQSDIFQAPNQSKLWILSIYQDSNGIFWIGTTNGLIRYDQANQRFSRYAYEGDVNGSYTGVIEDSHGNLWVNSQTRLFIFDRASEKLTSVILYDGVIARNINWNGMLLHPNGTLFIASWDGLYLVDTAQKVITRHLKQQLENEDGLSASNLQCLLLTDENTLWIGTYGGGLDRLDLRTNQITVFRHDSRTPGSLSGNNIMALYQDRSGVVWVGDRVYGLNKFSRYRNKFRLYTNLPYQENTLSNNYIRGMCQDRRGLLWIATQFGGLNSYDPITDKYTHYRHNPKDATSLANDEVWAVLEDHEEVLWVGTNPGGVQMLDRSSGRFIRSEQVSEDAHVNVIYEDRANNLWIGTNNGAVMISSDRKSSIRHFDDFGLGFWKIGRDIQSIYQDRAGDIWFGTNNGIVRFNPQTKQLQSYQKELGIENPDGVYVNSFCEDSYNQIWMATKGSGLIVFDRKKEQFVHVDENSGLPHNNTYGIIADNYGNLWISTDNGIAKLNLASGRFENFGQSDGLQGKEFNRRAFCQTREGEIFFGGINGINSFYPDQIVKNQIAPKLVITSFRASGLSLPSVTYDTDKLVELKYFQNSITITFSALDFNDPQNNLYRYKLTGFDNDWQAARNKFEVVYQNLAPGDYTFFLKGSNNNGVWSEQLLTLRLRIAPPIWRTNWAYLFYLLLIVAIIAVLFRYQAGSYQLKLAEIQTVALERENHQRAQSEAEIKLKNVELEEANLKLRELDRIKANFTAMLVHDLKSPLTAVSATLQILAAEPIAIASKTAKLLSVSEKNLDKVVNLVNEALEFYRSDSQDMSLTFRTIDLKELLSASVESARLTAREKKISIEFYAAETLPKISADAGKLERVFANLLANAVKFTPAQGKIRVAVEICQGTGVESGLTFLEVSITDTGEGIPAEEIPYLFELYRQAESKQKKAGVGLGLAIVKRIIAAHKGNISVQSQLGVGSCFTVSLPTLSDVAMVGGDAANNTSIMLPNQQSSTRNAAISMILLVEDDPINQEVIRQQLSAFGYQVDTAGSSREALEKFSQQDYQLVFMDYNLPDRNGLETTIEIRRLEQGQPRCWIVALTAEEVSDKAQWQQAGIDYFIPKPFKLDQIEELFASLYTSRKPLAPSSSSPIKNQPEPLVKRDQILRPSPLPRSSSIDLTVLEAMQAIFGDDGSAVIELIDGFIEETDKSFQDLTRAFAENRSTDARKIAHTLKGRCGNLGITQLMKLSAALEKSLKNDEPLNSALLAEMEAEFKQVRIILLAEQQKQNSSFV